MIRFKYYKIFIAGLLLCQVQAGIAQQQTFFITDRSSPGSFPIAADSTVATLYTDSADATVVRISLQALQGDVKEVTGKTMTFFAPENKQSRYAIIAGTLGHCDWIDELVKQKRIDAASKGQWETFSIHIVDRPGRGIDKALVIAGSDRRGTAYGIFHVSRTMGVSPFTWWADVKPRVRKSLFAKGQYVSASPSVKYRGIFINDEDWGLQPWAAMHLDKEIKDIGPNTYARVFELMLRLKANYIWPAMHPCTKAFYYYRDNPKVANDYAIIVGGSHCEPMLRNNVFEWAENFEHEYGKKPGEWRYDINKNEIYQYWDDRVKQAVNFESVYTIGMRGIHDGSMPGPRDPNEKLKLLENVINDQRKILGLNFGREASEVPQIFVPYKEVLSLYRRGLKLADDVTIIWPDDNHGYIRQLPNETERKRSGGHGVYYHLSYWGSPHDYLWLSSISPSLISYEMTKAYNYGAGRLWVFNIGDIKPAELELQFAMDLAWDVSKWSPGRAHLYTKQWALEVFGETLAKEIASIKDEYYLLAANGKPEHLGAIDYSYAQAIQRLKRYEALLAAAQRLQPKIPARLADAYYELVLYPVWGAKLMNEKIFYARSSFHDNTGYDRLLKKDQAKAAGEAFDSIRLITEKYNRGIAGGKWNGIMSWHPRDLPVFNMPPTAEAAGKLSKDSLAKEYFKQQHPVFVLNADAFDRKKTPGAAIAVIRGLGINERGVTPANQSVSPLAPGDSVLLEFAVPASLKTGSYTIEVRCLPTFDVNTAKNLRYSIAVDNEQPQQVNVHAEADSKEWKANVLRGYSSGLTTHSIRGEGKKVLKVWLKDINLVINTIGFYRMESK